MLDRKFAVTSVDHFNPDVRTLFTGLMNDYLRGGRRRSFQGGASAAVNRGVL